MTTGNEKEPKAHNVQDFRLSYEVGGTGLEPVTPSLSTRGERSGLFAEVRSGRIDERNPPGDQTAERTQANAERLPLLPRLGDGAQQALREQGREHRAVASKRASTLSGDATPIPDTGLSRRRSRVRVPSLP